MQIGKLTLNPKIIEESTISKKNNEVNKLSTNPFGVSFKGNVIQADVFENTKVSSPISQITKKSKLFASSVVSGINSFNESFKSRMNAIVSFGKKITSNVFDTIERIGNTEITFNIDGIKNRLFPDRQYSLKNLSMKSVDDLKEMWEELEPLEV